MGILISAEEARNNSNETLTENSLDKYVTIFEELCGTKIEEATNKGLFLTFIYWNQIKQKIDEETDKKILEFYSPTSIMEYVVTLLKMNNYSVSLKVNEQEEYLEIKW